MPPVSLKYFHDHERTSVFDNQAALAAVLEPFGKRALVESDEVSPLTVRLFNAKHALDQMCGCVNSLAIRQFPTVFCDRGAYNGPPGPFALHREAAPSGSIQYARSFLTPRNGWTTEPTLLGAGIGDYRFEYQDPQTVKVICEDAKVHTFDLHSGLYQFFANLESTFDRLRLELNSIYFDGQKVLDSQRSTGNKYWRSYLKPNDAKVRALASNGWTALVGILTGPLAISIDQRTDAYRNRLIHDGGLEIEINHQSGVVYIPNDPLAVPVVFGTELKPFVTGVFSDVQMLLRQVYAQFIADIGLRNQIPII